MIKLDKNEKIIWQMFYDLVFIDNDTDTVFDIDYFILTNKNLRFKYKSNRRLLYADENYFTFPLEMLDAEDLISYRLNDDKLSFVLNVNSKSYHFKVNNTTAYRVKKHLDIFLNNLNKYLNPIISYNMGVTPYIEIMKIISEIKIDDIRNFILSLEESILPLTEDNVYKIKNLFPIPNEQIILWADCEFDLRCSGIVCTNMGCYIKTDSVIIKEMFNNSKSILYFYKWEYFNPKTFSLNSSNNPILEVDEKCRTYFINKCIDFSSILDRKIEQYKKEELVEFNDYNEFIIGFMPGALNVTQESINFINRYIRNTNGRHGFVAEKANNLGDQLAGRKATVIGDDKINGKIPKNGPDREIKRTFFNNQYIQTKYCRNASETFKAAFNGSENGVYQYSSKEYGVMQLEVPPEQYDEILNKFDKAIKEGRVLDFKGNPVKGKAEHYVRKGIYTYEQTLKILEFGSIEGIIFDIKEGFIKCKYTFGISALISTYISFCRTKNLKVSIREGLKVGAKVFGLTMINHIMLCQLYRTPLLQTKTKNINLRNAIITSSISLIVYSIPDIYNLLLNNISFKQFMKNTFILGASIAGSTAGAKVGKIIGSKVAGPVGSNVGMIAGGYAGGVAASVVAKKGIDIFSEDDIVIFSRLFNAVLSSMIQDYMLNEKEINKLSDHLLSIDSSQIQALNKQCRHAINQEEIISHFLEPYFYKVLKKRKKFKLPTLDKITKEIEKISK